MGEVAADGEGCKHSGWNTERKRVQNRPTFATNATKTAKNGGNSNNIYNFARYYAHNARALTRASHARARQKPP